ncbi:MAG: hypothetical protein H6581_17670 [Bacteroidia bacterium]|nr:hypothetical protein [Bacteroidia bacterium]
MIFLKPKILFGWLILFVVSIGYLPAQNVILDDLFQFKGKNYNLRVTRSAEAKMSFSLYLADDKPGNITSRFDLNQYETFEAPFLARMQTLLGSSPSPTETDELKRISTQEFIKIVKGAYVEPDYQPVAGWITVNKLIPMIKRRDSNGGWVDFYDVWRQKRNTRQDLEVDSLNQGRLLHRDSLKSIFLSNHETLVRGNGPFNNKGNSTYSTAIAIVDSVQCEFRNGNLENVTVQAHDLEGRFLKFSNGIPISMDTKMHLDDFENSALFEQERDEYVLVAADLLSYLENLQLGGKDYSPADQVVWIKPEDGRKKLYKLRTREILEARVYSDFVGFDESKPNGLIQSEVRKSINLYAKRKFFRYNDPRLFNYGIFSGVELVLGISKLEKHNREFSVPSLNEVSGNQLRQTRFLTPVQLLQFENFKFGADLNVFLFELQQLKSVISLDAGFRFGRIALTEPKIYLNDSLDVDTTGAFNQFGVNSFRFHPLVKWEVFPDERYGFHLAYQTDWIRLAHPSILLVRDIDGFPVSRKVESPWAPLNRFEFEGHFKAGNSGKFFFRYRFYSQMSNWKINFHQAQIGYSFYLMSTQK